MNDQTTAKELQELMQQYEQKTGKDFFLKSINGIFYIKDNDRVYPLDSLIDVVNFCKNAIQAT